MCTVWRWGVRLGVLGVVSLMWILLGTSPAAAEAKKFTLINVVFDDTKIWLPSSLIVQEGDEVELTLINKLDLPHGFKLEAFGVEEVVQAKAQATVKFTAKAAGLYPYICQMHPPHIGGQILVVK